MTDTTTIQVRRDQAKKLKEIQGPSGNYKTAIDTVLEGHMRWRDARGEEEDGVDADAIADAVTADLLAQLPPRIADELQVVDDDD